MEWSEREMRPRVKASILWGAVGVLAFLVLLQGYELWTGYRYALGVKFGVSIAVAAGATVASYLADQRLFE